MNSFQRKLEKNICRKSSHIPPEQWKIKKINRKGVKRKELLETLKKNWKNIQVAYVKYTEITTIGQMN